MKTPVIRTKEFILRPPAPGDAADFVAFLHEPRMSRYMTQMPYPYTRAAAVTWLKKVKREANRAERDSYHFVIKKDGRAAGVISLQKITPGHQATLGYWLARKYWGQGIMTKAVGLVSGFGLKKLKLHRIQAYVFTANPASKRVLEKNGFRSEGIARKAVQKNGRLYDAYRLAKIR